VWASSGPAGPSAREAILPTGLMHVVVRLSSSPLRTFTSDEDSVGTAYRHAIVGGVRDDAYIRSTRDPIDCVGAMLETGAAEAVLGVPAGELTGGHFDLDELWSGAAARIRDRLGEATDARERVLLFEEALAARLPRVRAMHPAVAHALARLREETSVAQI